MILKIPTHPADTVIMDAPVTTFALYDSEVEDLRTILRSQLARLTFYRREDTPVAIRYRALLESLEAA